MHVLCGCRQKPSDFQLCRFQQDCLVILNDVQLQSTHCPLLLSPMGRGYPSRSLIYNLQFIIAKYMLPSCLNCDMFLGLVPSGFTDCYFQLIAWHQTGDKPIPEAMLSKIYAAIMPQYALKGYSMPFSSLEYFCYIKLLYQHLNNIKGHLSSVYKLYKALRRTKLNLILD